MSVRDLIYGKKPEGAGEACLSLVLSASRPLYRAGLGVHRSLYQKGLKKKRKLPCRVVCIGNITLGGSGKTPVTMLAAKLLRKKGKKVCILSRGYRRSGKPEDLVVVSDENGMQANIAESGDEPYLMARNLPGVPVLVCADRYKSGMYAIENFQPDLVLMDDGFQRWALERDCDVVCVDASRSLGNMKLFPRGDLREPLQGLSRAQAAILTRCGKSGEARGEEVKKYAGDIPVLKLRYSPGEILPVKEDAPDPVNTEQLQMKHVILFSGIAAPESFFAMAKTVAPRVRTTLSFPDHVKYDKETLMAIRKEFSYHGADAMITTEKDAVKLAGKKLPRLPLYYIPLETKFESGEDERRFLEILLEGKKSE